MDEFNLNQTIKTLHGPPKEHIIVNNYWAATAFNRYHKDSKAEIEILIHGVPRRILLTWDSDFSNVTMKEDKDIANHGAVAIAWFLMSVLLDYNYVEQSEIGDGVDYRFQKTEPNEDDLNFLNNYHYVEISGILEESRTNTLQGRIKDKHKQINRGGKCNEPSSVIVTLFNTPITIKEIHK